VRRKLAPLSILVLAGFVLAPFESKPAYGDATTSESGGTISVGVSAGSSSGDSPGAASGTDASDNSNGNAPVCTSTVLTLNNDLGPPPGVTTPGSWYTITCSDASGGNTTENLWISAGSPPPSMPAVSPRSVALQAENSLRLPTPSLSFNPPDGAVVNLPTWLWVDGAIWHPHSVSATVGSVTATATANPVSVTWNMGDGGSTACQGPGSAYQTDLPSSGQVTGCSYTYGDTSAGQPSADGDPDQGVFTVSATVAWEVSWTAQGTAGGGALPGLFTSSQAQLRVGQVESVNS